MSDFAHLLQHWSLHRGEPMALATVVRTTGSTYRKPGARMLIRRSGETVGLLSGGCLEEEIAGVARQVMKQGAPICTGYDTRRFLGCHGTIDLLIEDITGEENAVLLRAAEESHRRREAVVGATVFASVAERLGSFPLGGDGALAGGADLAAALRTSRPLHRSWPCAGGSTEALLQTLAPPIRLVIFGAGPDLLPLLGLAATLHWPATVVSHPAQEPPELPASVTRVALHPEEIGEQLDFDPRTAAVVMTHNYGRDLALLAQLLPRRPGYLGLLGPRRRREQILGDLLEMGVDPAGFGALHSPIGLDLGADTPEEIALAIVAEIRAAMSGRSGGFLRERRGAIHGEAGVQ